MWIPVEVFRRFLSAVSPYGNGSLRLIHDRALLHELLEKEGQSEVQVGNDDIQSIERLISRYHTVKGKNNRDIHLMRCYLASNEYSYIQMRIKMSNLCAYHTLRPTLYSSFSVTLHPDAKITTSMRKFLPLVWKRCVISADHPIQSVPYLTFVMEERVIFKFLFLMNLVKFGFLPQNALALTLTIVDTEYDYDTTTTSNIAYYDYRYPRTILYDLHIIATNRYIERMESNN
jgi:hypothetical protein